MGENSGETTENSNSIVRAFEGAAIAIADEVENDVFDVDDDDDNDNDDDDNDEKKKKKILMMKRMISEHPLFHLLIDTHFNCLKVGLGEIDRETAVTTAYNNNSCQATSKITPNSPELDKFMEAYCMALRKLKEAMEEPLKDATSFISTIYSQLNDLSLPENQKK
ncbi:homeobox protein knotted-1-like LET6 [Humulus lupulus]|uniref:homeobox protein knotted-1-like LET6 n=1 Tax=Humulus lupulus TaxID=3486 RepID=UPI002B411C8D|nr:homeobox protein knotted-1-like LET6 [Humulus lupulus]